MFSLSQNSNWISWWLDGLLLLLPESLQGWFSSSLHSSTLHYDEDQLALLDQDTEESSYYDVNSPLDLSSLERDLKERKASDSLKLTLAARYGLTKQLKLPAAAETELDTILKFEVDRQTPFTADQVYYGYQLLERNKSEKTLEIQLDVVPKKVLDPILEALTQADIQIAHASLGNNQHKAINLITRDKNNTSAGISKYLTITLALLLLILIAINLVLPIYQTQRSIDLTDSAIQQARKDAMEVNGLRSQYETDQERRKTLQSKMRERVTSTRLLDELTRLIPDDTYLTRVQIREPTINIQGESSSATQLISLLDQSELFSETRFRSPVTTNISTGKERFQISTKLNPVEGDKP